MQVLEQEQKKVDQLSAEKLAIKTILKYEIVRMEPWLRHYGQMTERLEKEMEMARRKEYTWMEKCTVQSCTPCASCGEFPQWVSDADSGCESCE